MKNLYDGIAVLDQNGEATVQLPNWFEALNPDFRYQLTCIGGIAPVFIADEIRNNSFRIAPEASLAYESPGRSRACGVMPSLWPIG